MSTCCLHQGAYFRAINMHKNDMQLKQTWNSKEWQKESCKYASWFTSYKQCKMQQNIPGSTLSENQENWAETDILLLYKQV